MKKKDSLIKSFIPSILVAFIYVVLYFGYIVYSYFDSQLQTTYNINYLVCKIAVSLLIFLFSGIVIAYISSIKKKNIIAVIAEVILIDLPALFLCLLPLIAYSGIMPSTEMGSIFLKLLSFEDTVCSIGAVLIGCEIVRIIRSIKKVKN